VAPRSEGVPSKLADKWWEEKRGTPSALPYGGAVGGTEAVSKVAASVQNDIASSTPIQVPVAPASVTVAAVSGTTVAPSVKGGDKLPEKHWETKAGTPSGCDSLYGGSVDAPAAAQQLNAKLEEVFVAETKPTVVEKPAPAYSPNDYEKKLGTPVGTDALY
jgi:hypothetical protein